MINKLLLFIRRELKKLLNKKLSLMNSAESILGVSLHDNEQ